MPKRSKYSKCALCGRWRPIRELKLHLVISPLLARDGPPRHRYHCPTHTEKQKLAANRRWYQWCREFIRHRWAMDNKANDHEREEAV